LGAGNEDEVEFLLGEGEGVGFADAGGAACDDGPGGGGVFAEDGERDAGDEDVVEECEEGEGVVRQGRRAEAREEQERNWQISQ